MSGDEPMGFLPIPKGTVTRTVAVEDVKPGDVLVLGLVHCEVRHVFHDASDPWGRGETVVFLLFRHPHSTVEGGVVRSWGRWRAGQAVRLAS